MPHKNPWKKLSSKIAYDNSPYWRIREDEVITPTGTKGRYAYVETEFAVSIVAFNEANEVLLVGQYRYPTDIFSWEVPAGGGAKGEIPLQTAHKELAEEAGMTADEWIALSRYQTWNGASSEWTYPFIARNLHPTHAKEQDDEQIDEVKNVALSDALAMIDRGEITDGQSIATLYLAARHLGMIK
ncbi:MAG: NUDIX hydrolase [Candidatus Spechtbacterales bacterium]